MSHRNDNPNLTPLRARAWRLFEAGEFAGALDAFRELLARGEAGASERDALVELLIDRGDGERALDVLDDAVEHADIDHGDREHIALLAQRFDVADRYAIELGRQREAGMRLLEALAESQDAALWSEVLTPDRFDRIERSFGSPADLLDALEQVAFAPAETGLPGLAWSRIEAIGSLAADDPAVSRAAERLLHAFGDAAAAYRVENARKAAGRREPAAPPSASPPQPPAVSTLAGLRVVLAGGHPALRAVIERDLARSGVTDVRPIPSAKEASRAGRDVRAVVAGSDVVVLLIRQLAHSTDAQVRRAADQSGVPVVVAESAGIGGVHRALARFLAERDAPDAALDTRIDRT